MIDPSIALFVGLTNNYSDSEPFFYTFHLFKVISNNTCFKNNVSYVRQYLFAVELICCTNKKCQRIEKLNF